MSADFILLRTTLPQCREVVILAELCRCESDLILGRLARFWIWADAETTDGVLPGVTVDMLVRALHIPEAFFTALVSVGWLEVHEWGLQIPNWDRWFSDSAKARYGEVIRKRLQRSGCDPPKVVNCENVRTISGQCPDNVRTKEDRRKEKEYKKIPPLKSPPQKRGGETIDWSRVIFPEGCDTPEIRAAILEWLEYRRKIGKRYRDPEKQISLLLMEHGAEIVKAVCHSIAQGYQGCFMPQKGGHDGHRGSNWAAGPGQRHPDDATIQSRGW